MARPTKSLEAADRLGVYKQLAEVPEHYRLANFTDTYEGVDVWQAFCEEYEYGQGSYARYEEEVDRVGDHWQAFMADRDRHHALATPADVDEWCTTLLREFSRRRALDYWLRVNRFYDWLQWHTEHPHRYNPALMAAVEGGSARKIWELKAARTEERRDRYRGEDDE